MAAPSLAWVRPARDLGLTRSRFLALIGLLTGMLAARPQIQDPDFWWHLRNGQTMLASGHLIHINPYAFMAVGHHWVLQEWLGEIWMAAVAAGAGRPGVVLVYWLITLAMLVVIWARALELGPAHGLTVGVGLLLAALAAYPILGPRSQMDTYLLIGVVLLVAERQLRRGGRPAWLLPPLFLVWSNLHAGFVMGLILLAAVLACEGVCVALGLRGPRERARISQLAAAGAVSVAASMVNPNGLVTAVYPFLTQFSQAQQELIQEWQSPDFHAALLLPLLLLIATLAVLLVRYRGLPLRELAVLAIGLVVSLQSVRNEVILVVVATPVWIHLAEQGRQQLAGAWARRERRQPPLVALVEALYLVAMVAILGTQVATAATPSLNSPTYVNSFPVCAANWLATAPSGLRIFNQYGDGGFLAYRLHQDKVFIFGDAALMGPALLQRYAGIIDLSPGWLASLDSSPSQLVLFERGSAFPDALQQEPGWTLVYRDRRLEAFERTSLLASLRLPSNPDRAYWLARANPTCASQAVALPGR